MSAALKLATLDFTSSLPPTSPLNMISPIDDATGNQVEETDQGHDEENPDGAADGTGVRRSSSDQGTSKIVRLPEWKEHDYMPGEFVWALQEWDGRVTEVHKTHLVALLFPIGSQLATETEIVEIPRDLISGRANDTVREGSIFRFTVGKSRKRTGQISQRVSVYFRPVSAGAQSNAEETAFKIHQFFASAVHAPTAPENRI